METKFNELSKKLLEEVQAAMPKRGQTIWFESVRPKGRGTTVLSTDMIFDPHANKGEGATVDIAYITGKNPAQRGKPAEEIFGRIQFTRSQQGRIGIMGGNKRDEILFQYLFLTNQNGGNQKKPWFIAGTRPVLFKQDQPGKKAEDLIDFKRQVRAAGDLIDTTPEDQLRDLALGLDMEWVTPFTTPAEIQVKLLAIADKIPEKILGLAKDASLVIKADIKKARKANIIQYNTELQVWSWPDTGDKICTVPPDRRPEDALTTYFMGKGAETYKLIKSLLEKK